MKAKPKKSPIKKIHKPKIKIPKNYVWAPQPGPQAYAATCPADATFFGGTRGGGKSDCLIGRHIRGVEKYGNHWNGLILRRKFKEFAELRRRWDELIAAGLPAERIGGDQQTNYVRFPKHGNAQIVMTAVQRAEMLDAFQSQQFTEISLEEAPNFPFIDRMMDKLKGSLRSPHGVPCRFFLTGNPGGPGANIIKYMFIKPDPEGLGKPQIDEEEWSSVFIKSTLDDNPILCENDPGYVKRLKAIKDTALREAWLNGNWDVFIGQAFDFTQRHIIKPIPVPQYVPVYMTFDWGYGAPFSVGWWWVDSDGRIYRFSEWYGWNGKPNQGLRITDSEIAKGIIEREKKLGISARVLKRYAGHDCFNKKPSYEKGGQGPSTYEEFKKLGLNLTKIFPDRAVKMKQFRERLLIPSDDSMPMMVVYDTCHRFIEMIPSLCLDEENIEQLDTDQEDHVYDEGALMCLARPIGVQDEAIQKTLKEEEEKAKLDRLDNISQAAWKEVDKIKEELDTEYEYEKLGMIYGEGM